MRIRLDQITFDAGTQIRAAIDQQVVTDYAEAMTNGEAFPAIVLFHDGNQHYLADGFHRFMAAQRLAFVDFEAEVRPGTKQDALWFALGANKQHGKQLTSADKKHAIELALQAWGQGGRTQAEIAKQIGVAESTLSYHATRLSDIGRLQRPASVIDKDGRKLPIPARSGGVDTDRRADIAARLSRGEAPAAIAKAVHIHRNRVFEVKREMGLSTMPDRSKAAISERRDRMRQMASEGYSSRQIASAVGVGENKTRATMRELGIDVPADRAIGRSHRHDSNRIVDQIVIDAANLTEGVNLIDFGSLDSERLGEWADSLTASCKSINGFIKRLLKEQQNHGEAA